MRGCRASIAYTALGTTTVQPVTILLRLIFTFFVCFLVLELATLYMLQGLTSQISSELSP